MSFPGEEYREAAVRTVESLPGYIEADGTAGSDSAGTAIAMDKEHRTSILTHPMACGQSPAAPET